MRTKTSGHPGDVIAAHQGARICDSPKIFRPSRNIGYLLSRASRHQQKTKPAIARLCQEIGTVEFSSALFLEQIEKGVMTAMTTCASLVMP
jgi:hypothetical protein